MTGLAKLTVLVLAAAALGAAAAPWRVPRATVAEAFAGGIARGAGLRAAAAGRVTFKLLPRPRLQAADLTVSAEDGAVLVDAPLLKAELDISSLLRGRWRLDSATLVEPTLTVDVDRLAARAPSAALAPRGAPALLRLRSGLLKTRSSAGFADLLATGIDATASWSGDGDDLVVAGSAVLRGTTAQFTAALQRPALSFTPAGSAASLQVSSPLFDVSAEGVLSGGSQEQFAGRASLATASLPRLLRALGGALGAMPASTGAKRLAVSGDLVARPRDLSLSNAQLRLDRARFEGTLAWRQENGRGLLAGTLATDMLDLGALAGDGLDAPEVGDLYAQRLTASPFGTDVDMRISATAARLGRVTLEDAAFAALVRGDRLELTLDEAGAYGGVTKARALLTLGPDGIDAHAELSAKHVDLDLMSRALSGRARVGGAMTARAALDGHGASLREVVAGLAGDGDVGVEGGRVAGLSLAPLLRRAGRRGAPDGDRRGPPTLFDPAHWVVEVRRGVVRIPDGRLTAPGVALAFGAETALADGRVDLHAVAARADGAGAPAGGGPTMPFDLRGFWSGPLTLDGGPGGPPSAALPLDDGVAAGR